MLKAFKLMTCYYVTDKRGLHLAYMRFVSQTITVTLVAD